MIGGTGKDFDAISRNGPLLGYGHDMLTVRSVKLYADGCPCWRMRCLLRRERRRRPDGIVRTARVRGGASGARQVLHNGAQWRPDLTGRAWEQPATP